MHPSMLSGLLVLDLKTYGTKNFDAKPRGKWRTAPMMGLV